MQLAKEPDKHAAPFYYHGDPHEPYVSLTIDDCWNLKNTRKMLEIAAAQPQNPIPLTFLPGGNLFLNYDFSFWQEVLLAGHEIENHTASHPHLIDMDDAEILDQIDRAQKYYQYAIGQSRPAAEIPPMRYVRPPWGEGFVPVANEEKRVRQQDRMTHLVYKRNMEIVLWSNDIYQIETIGPGAIVLLHTNDADLVAFQRVLTIVKDRGLIPVTVNELLNPQMIRQRKQDQMKFERSI